MANGVVVLRSAYDAAVRWCAQEDWRDWCPSDPTCDQRCVPISIGLLML